MLPKEDYPPSSQRPAGGVGMGNSNVTQRTAKGENPLPLQLTLKPFLMGKFTPIFQQGFVFETRVGISIETFLCQDLGLDPQFVRERISTIFLDGKAVDSIATTLLREGAILALSSAMPGLAGATLRRGGPYASLRASISYRENGGSAPAGKGRITVKLFNLLIGELGPLFLEKGILVTSPELLNFLLNQGEDFRQGCGPIVLAGKVVDYETLLSENGWAENREVELRVVPASTGTG